MMVATDIAARGLDIEGISHVINFDMPDTADAYIHRIGRTGRAKRTGEAFTLTTKDDFQIVKRIESIMKQKLPRETLADFDYDVLKPEYPQTTGKPMLRKKQTSPSQPKHRARRSHQTTRSGISSRQ